VKERLLVDQAARDRVQGDLDATLFVEAGAGTGKTTALVGRLVHLIASGRTTIERLVAITFTEAAAGELRDAVLVALERAAADAGRDAGERARCSQALADLDEAAIETLHAFAMRVLSMHPLEAGLPPGFRVVDEALGTVAFAERWLDHLDAMLDDPALAVPLRRAFAMEVSVEGLRALARTLHENWDRLEDDAAVIPLREQPDLAAVTAPWLQELRSVCAQRRYCVDTGDRLHAHLETLEEWATHIEAAGDDVECLRLLTGRGVKTGGGQARAWAGVTPGELRAALGEIEERRARLLQSAADAVIPAVYMSLRDFVLAYAEERRETGRLEFHDLLVRTRRLLRDSPGVRRALRDRFTHLLIDEFQDTDPLQTEIAFLLASEPSDDSARAGTPDAGRLFFVGDPKQSIYRFRRADIELYESVRTRFADGVLHLRQNFRSGPAIIEWVNALFSQLMGDVTGEGQAPNVALHAGRAPHPAGVTVSLLGRPVEGRMADVREAEAADIAAMLGTVKGSRWQVAERGPDGGEVLRDARYADIAVLLPTRTSLPQLLAALEEREIPYRLESRSLVYETQEVRELLGVLTAIDDPTDEVALIAALRSPGFAVADDELLDYARAGGRWDYRLARPAAIGAEHPVAAAMAWLREAYRRRWWAPVSTLVEQVIRERRLFELAMVDRRPRERWQRLRFVLDQARAFSDAGGRTLREFLAWAQHQADEEARVIESVVPEDDDDAVRIMTVHAAKGLEFPVVLLAGLNVRPLHRPASALWADASGPPELRLSRHLASQGFQDLSARDQQFEASEQVRLLYVAATRARDYLIVSVYREASYDRSAAARIEFAAEEAPETWQRAEPAPSSTATTATSRSVVLDTAADREAWQARRAADIAAGRSLRAVSATGLAHANAPAAMDDPNLRKDPPVEEQPPWRRGRAGTALGRAVHSVLQTVDLVGGEDLEATARAQAAAEGIPGRVGQVARLARAALDSDVVRAALASGRYWREIYVGAGIDGPGAERTVVEGFIDLLYETEDGLVVVDYKTDALSEGDSIDAALARYRLQGAAYALALTEALGRRVERCVFVFLSASGPAERELPALADAMDEARVRALEHLPGHP